MTRLINTMVLLLMVFSTGAIADLKSQCDSLEQTYVKAARVTGYSVATIFAGNKYGFEIKLDGKWYKVILKENSESPEYRDQFSSTARIAKVLNIPVNICINDNEEKFLLGMELP